MKKQIKYTLLSIVLLLGTTGCTTYIKGDDGKTVINKTTGQSLTENILCRPTDEETIMLYEANGYDLSELPYCSCKDYQEEKEEQIEADDSNEEKEVSESKKQDESKKNETKQTEEKKENEENTNAVAKEDTDTCKEFTISGKYEGLWTNIFVRPLAWVILFFGKLTGNFGIGLIITTILIRLIVFPLTRKSTMQSEKMKQIQPEMDRIDKKYEGKDKNDREIAMAQAQEKMMLYKKYDINPISGCLPALLQLPLFIAFLDAINRVPAIFEEKLLSLHLGMTPRIGIGNGNWFYIVLTLLVAVTTFYSFKNTQNNNTANNDMMKQTKTMMNVFTIMIIVMSIFMSSALNIYWIASNVCTLIQNYLIKRSMK